MSQIIKKLEAVRTGKHYTMQEPLIIDATDTIGLDLGTYYQEYTVRVKLGATVRVKDDTELEAAKRAVKRGLEDLIFGEFRPLINKAKYLLYDHRIDEAKVVLDEIEKIMFYEA